MNIHASCSIPASLVLLDNLYSLVSWIQGLRGRFISVFGANRLRFALNDIFCDEGVGEDLPRQQTPQIIGR